jgi:hypothetical protein
VVKKITPGALGWRQREGGRRCAFPPYGESTLT